jgi:hypothetical protein
MKPQLIKLNLTLTLNRIFATVNCHMLFSFPVHRKSQKGNETSVYFDTSLKAIQNLSSFCQQALVR